MDLSSLRQQLHRAARWFDATPAETAGLVALLLGGVCVLVVLAWMSSPRAVEDTSSPSPAESAPVVGAELSPDTVTVHVAGAVVRPGLVRVPAGARVADAIEAAGGAVGSANLDQLNLARPVADGERIDVLRLGEATETTGGEAASSGVAADGRVDLNAATAEQLQQLPGIGPVLASRIVDHRERNGPFTDVGALRDVAGIGERTFQSLADLVRV